MGKLEIRPLIGDARKVLNQHLVIKQIAVLRRLPIPEILASGNFFAALRQIISAVSSTPSRFIIFGWFREERGAI